MSGRVPCAEPPCAAPDSGSRKSVADLAPFPLGTVAPKSFCALAATPPTSVARKNLRRDHSCIHAPQQSNNTRILLTLELAARSTACPLRALECGAGVAASLRFARRNQSLKYLRPTNRWQCSERKNVRTREPLHLNIQTKCGIQNAPLSSRYGRAALRASLADKSPGRAWAFPLRMIRSNARIVSVLHYPDSDTRILCLFQKESPSPPRRKHPKLPLRATAVAVPIRNTFARRTRRRAPPCRIPLEMDCLRNRKHGARASCRQAPERACFCRREWGLRRPHSAGL